jgi:hypothetical protein
MGRGFRIFLTNSPSPAKRERGRETTARMHDSRDGGGRTVPGATVEEVRAHGWAR